MGAGADPSPSPGVAVAAAAACDPARSPLRPSPPTPGVVVVVLGTLPSGGVARTPPQTPMDARGDDPAGRLAALTASLSLLRHRRTGAAAARKDTPACTRIARVMHQEDEVTRTNRRSDYIHSYPTRVARRTTGGMGRIRDYFVEQGLGPKDIPVAFVFHEVISVAFAASTWVACYGIQPSVTVCAPLAKLPIAAKAAGAFEKALAFSDAKVGKMTWLSKVPIVKNAAPRRLTVSLAESLMFRGAIKPITFGGKLYLSYRFVQWTKTLGKEEEATVDVKGGKKAKKRTACLSLALPMPGESRISVA